MDNWNELSPLQKLFKSRKFLLLLLDTFVSLVLFGVGVLMPAAMEDVKLVIGLLQPIFVALIGAIAWEDAANANN